MRRRCLEPVLIAAPTVAVWLAQPDVLAARTAFAASAAVALALYGSHRWFTTRAYHRRPDRARAVLPITATAATAVVGAIACWWAAASLGGDASYASGFGLAAGMSVAMAVWALLAVPVDAAVGRTVGVLRRLLAGGPLIDVAPPRQAGEAAMPVAILPTEPREPNADLKLLELRGPAILACDGRFRLLSRDLVDGVDLAGVRRHGWWDLARPVPAVEASWPLADIDLPLLGGVAVVTVGDLVVGVLDQDALVPERHARAPWPEVDGRLTPRRRATTARQPQDLGSLR